MSFPIGGPQQTPGVIVMAIDDRRGRDGVVVVFNAAPEPTTQTVASLAGRRFSLHPVQAKGGDPIVKGSRHDARTGAFSVPARTVAVFMAK